MVPRSEKFNGCIFTYFDMVFKSLCHFKCFRTVVNTSSENRDEYMKAFVICCFRIYCSFKIIAMQTAAVAKAICFTTLCLPITSNLFNNLKMVLSQIKSQQIIKNTKISNFEALSLEVPQGSILGLLLFIIFTNDVITIIGTFSFLSHC